MRERSPIFGGGFIILGEEPNFWKKTHFGRESNCLEEFIFGGGIGSLERKEVLFWKGNTNLQRMRFDTRSGITSRVQTRGLSGGFIKL